MKRIAIILIIVAASITLQAQQMPMYSQYMLNGFLLNPAMAGTEAYTPLRLTARQQWVGIKDAPSTQALSGHMLLSNQKMGLGGYLFNDKFGPIGQTGLQVSYSYHLPIYGIDSKLAFGLSATAFQFAFDESKFKLINDDDNAITYKSQTQIVPDANFGMYMYNKKYFVGFAATQLLEMDLNIDQEIQSNSLARHYYATAGYKFKVIDQKLDLEPSVLAKTTEETPVQVDFNIKAIYEKNYWLGVSYRHNDAVIALVGVKIDQYFLGYSFDYTLSNISNYSSGSHEIVIGINLGEGKQTGASLL